MTSVSHLDKSGFLAWTTLSRGWGYVAATFIIIVPLVQEMQALRKQIQLNKQRNVNGCDKIGLDNLAANHNDA